MNRYEDANEELTQVFLDVMEKYFASLQWLKIKLIFDSKKRIKQGKMLMASIEKASDKVKYLSKDNIAVEGYDLLLIVDQKAWLACLEKDKTRILRHELKHIMIDEKGTLTLVGHEIEDFYSELKFNEDDPEWKIRVAMGAESLYDQEKNMSKENKK